MSEYLQLLNITLSGSNVNVDNVFSLLEKLSNEDSQLRDIYESVIKDTTVLRNQSFIQELKEYLILRIEEEDNNEFNSFLNKLEPYSKKSYVQIVTSFSPSVETEFCKKIENVTYYAIYPKQFNELSFYSEVYMFKENKLIEFKCYPASRITNSDYSYIKDKTLKTIDYTFFIFATEKPKADDLSIQTGNLSKLNDKVKKNILGTLQLDFFSVESLKTDFKINPSTGEEQDCFVIETLRYFKNLSESYNEYVGPIKKYVGLSHVEKSGVVLVPRFFENLCYAQNFQGRDNAKISLKLTAPGGKLTQKMITHFKDNVAIKILNIPSVTIKNEKFDYYYEGSDYGRFLPSVISIFTEMCYSGKFMLNQNGLNSKIFSSIEYGYDVSIYIPSLNNDNLIPNSEDLELKMFKNIQTSNLFNENNIPSRFTILQRIVKDKSEIFFIPRGFIFFQQDYETKSQNSDLSRDYSSYSSSFITFDRIEPFSQIEVITDRGIEPSSLNCYIVTFNPNSSLELAGPQPFEQDSLDDKTKIFLMRGRDGAPIFTDPSVSVVHIQDIKKSESKPILGKYIYIVDNFKPDKITPGLYNRFCIEMFSYPEEIKKLANCVKITSNVSFLDFFKLLIRNVKTSFPEKEATNISYYLEFLVSKNVSTFINSEFYSSLKESLTESYYWLYDFPILLENSINKPIISPDVSYYNKNFLNRLYYHRDLFLNDFQINLIEKYKNKPLSTDETNSDLENDIIREVIAKSQFDLNPISFSFSETYNLLLEEFLSFESQLGAEINADFIVKNSVKDYNVVSVFIYSLLEVLNSKVDKKELMSLFSNLDMSLYKIIEMNDLFLVTFKPVEELVTTSKFSFTPYFSNLKIRRGLKGSPLVHCFFNIRIINDKNEDETIFKEITNYCYYYSFLTGQKMDLTYEDINIESVTELESGKIFKVYVPLKYKGFVLAIDKIKNDSKIQLLSKYAYLVFNFSYTLKNAIEDQVLNVTSNSFIESLIYGLNVDNISIDDKDITYFFNTDCIVNDSDLKFKIFPSNLFQIYTSVKGNSKQISEINRIQGADLMKSLKMDDIAEYILQYNQSIEFERNEDVKNDFLAVSSVKTEKGTIVTEKFSDYYNKQSFTTETRLNLSLKKFFAEGLRKNQDDISYLDYSNIQQMNNFIENKIQEFSSNSIKYALSKVYYSESLEEQDKIYKKEKVMWTKFSSDNFQFAVGLLNNVLIYSFISGRFIQISTLYHQNTIDIVFGNSFFCVTSSLNEVKIWNVITGTQLDIYVPIGIYQIKDRVNAFSNGESLRDIEITNVLYENSSGVKAPIDAEKDDLFYRTYKPIYYYQGKKLDTLSTKISKNTFFFSENDKYLAYNYAGKLRIINLFNYEVIKPQTINGLYSDEELPIPLEAAWKGKNFVGSSDTEILIFDIQNLSARTISINKEIPTNYYISSVEKRIIEELDYSEHYNKLSKYMGNFFWYYNIFVEIEEIELSFIKIKVYINNKSLTFPFELKFIENDVNNEITKEGSYYQILNLTSYIEFFAQNFRATFNENNVISISLNYLEIDKIAEISEESLENAPYLRGNSSISYIQGDEKDIICVHSYYKSQGINFTLVNVVKGVETIDYVIQGFVSPVYDFIEQNFYLINSENNLVELKTFQNITDRENINYIYSSKKKSSHYINVLVYNSIKTVKYNDTNRVSLKMGIDNYPISSKLCMNRFKNYSLMSLSENEYKDCNRVSFGNLELIADGKNLRILPKFVQKNLEPSNFVYWIYKTYNTRAKLEKFLTQILTTKRAVYESFPAVFYNGKPKILERFPRPIGSLELLSDYLSRNNVKDEIFQDPDLYDFLAPLFKRKNIYQIVFSAYYSADQRIIFVMENDIDLQSSTDENYRSEVIKSYVDRSLKEFAKIDSIVEKFSQVVPDVPLPNSRDYSIFSMLSRTELEGNTEERINTLISKSKDDASMSLIMSLAPLFLTEGKYNYITEENFTNYEKFFKMIQELERMEKFIKKELTSGTNYDTYSETSYLDLTQQFTDKIVKYYSLSDQFFKVMGKSAKVTGLTTCKEFITNAADEIALQEGRNYSQLLKRYLYKTGGKSLEVLEKQVKNKKYVSEKDKETMKILDMTISELENKRIDSLRNNQNKTERELLRSSVLIKTFIDKRINEVLKQDKKLSLLKLNLISEVQTDDTKAKKLEQISTEISKIYSEVFENYDYDFFNFEDGNYAKIFSLVKKANEIVPETEYEERVIRFINSTYDFFSELESNIFELKIIQTQLVDIERQRSKFKNNYSFEEVVISICTDKSFTFQEKIENLSLISGFTGDYSLNTISIKATNDEITKQFEIYDYKTSNEEESTGKKSKIFSSDKLSVERAKVNKERNLEEVPDFIRKTIVLDETVLEYDESTEQNVYVKRLYNSEFIFKRERYALVKAKYYLLEFIKTLSDSYDLNKILEILRIKLYNIGLKEEENAFDNLIKQEAFYSLYLVIKDMSLNQYFEDFFEGFTSILEKIVEEAYCDPLDEYLFERQNEYFETFSAFPSLQKLLLLTSLKNPSFSEMENSVYFTTKTELSKLIETEVNLIDVDFWKNCSQEIKSKFPAIVEGLVSGKITFIDFKEKPKKIQDFLSFLYKEYDEDNEIIAFLSTVESLKEFDCKVLHDILNKVISKEQLTDFEIEEFKKLNEFKTFRVLTEAKKEILLEDSDSIYLNSLESIIDKKRNSLMKESSGVLERISIYNNWVWYLNNGNNPLTENKKLYLEYHVEEIKNSIYRLFYLLSTKQYKTDSYSEEKLKYSLEKQLENIMSDYKNSEIQDQKAIVNLITIEFPREIEILSSNKVSELSEIKIKLKDSNADTLKITNTVCVSLPEVLKNCINDSEKLRRMIKATKVLENKEKYPDAEFTKPDNEDKVIFGKTQVKNTNLTEANFNAIDFGNEIIGAYAVFTKKITDEIYNLLDDFDYAGLTQISKVLKFQKTIDYNNEKYCVKLVNCLGAKDEKVTVVCLQKTTDGTRKMLVTKGYSLDLQLGENQLMSQLSVNLNNFSCVPLSEIDTFPQNIEYSFIHSTDKNIYFVYKFKGGSIVRAINDKGEQLFCWLFRNLKISSICEDKSDLLIAGLTKMQNSYRVRCGKISLKPSTTNNLIFNTFEKEYNLSFQVDKNSKIKILCASLKSLLIVSNNVNKVVILSDYKPTVIDIKPGAKNISGSNKGNLIAVNYEKTSEIYTYSGEKIQEKIGEAVWINQKKTTQKEKVYLKSDVKAEKKREKITIQDEDFEYNYKEPVFEDEEAPTVQEKPQEVERKIPKEWEEDEEENVKTKAKGPVKQPQYGRKKKQTK